MKQQMCKLLENVNLLLRKEIKLVFYVKCLKQYCSIMIMLKTV